MPTIEIHLQGVSPLLMHNPQLSDSKNEWAKRMAEITKKRTKTDEDYENLERFEWYGGLYVNKGEVCYPSANVRKCLIEAARMSRLGKNVERAISFTSFTIPLLHDGPKDIEGLYNESRFLSRMSVGVNKSRVMRVRPQFPTWAMRVEGVYQSDAGLNFEELERIVAMAGQCVGLGDNRVNGYGRFNGKVKKL